MDAARCALKTHFGYDAFRPGQVDVVAAVLSGSDTLGVLPTGGGKSLCYQVPALVLDGLTVVISPLISLMKDQVDRLVSRGVAATFLNSTLGDDEVALRLSRAARGDLRMLYVAPERFEAADLQRCLRQCQLALLAVDEAHCISEWGHEFRPSFRRIAAVRAALGFQQVVALTATATPRVRDDIARQLDMRCPRVIVGGFDRPNLHYTVRQCRTNDAKDRALGEIVRSHERPAIVYASTRATVERIAKRLTRSGIRALPYHGGLDDDHRRDVQETFMAGGVDTIVATNAFGMGIDKPNVRLVAHYAMPGTLEAYYQEAGRAGRDGKPGRCVLLNSHPDRFTHEWFIRARFPSRTAVGRVYEAIRAGHVGGLVTVVPPCEDAGAAMQFLVQRQLLIERRGLSTKARVRLLASPARIARELNTPEVHPELAVLRALWRCARNASDGEQLVDLDTLVPGTKGRSVRATLERLRDRQFVNFGLEGSGTYMASPDIAFDRLPIDWDAIAGRHSSEMAKLDMMQAYCYTTNCRRTFVLRYFGERTPYANCRNCDNCS
jgi:ATP-dependent DNA helicase RecQ